MGNIGDLNISLTVDDGSLKGAAASAPAELKKIEAAYDGVIAKMEKMRQEGIYGEAEFKKLSAAIEESRTRLKGQVPDVRQMQQEYQRLNKEMGGIIEKYYDTSKATDKASNSSSVFRRHSLNLGADLVILSYGVRQVYSDVTTLSDALKEGDVDLLKVAGSAASATISLLAMAPAAKALFTLLPAPFVAALPVIAAVTAALAGMFVFVTKLKDQFPALDRAARYLFSDLSFDDAVKEFEALQGAVDDAAYSLFLFGEKKEAFDRKMRLKQADFSDEQITNLLAMDEEEAKLQEDKFKREQDYQKELYRLDQQDKPRREGRHQSIKQETDAWAEFTKTFKEQLDYYRESETLTKDNLDTLLAQLDSNKLLADTLGKQTEFLKMQKDIYAELDKFISRGGDASRILNLSAPGTPSGAPPTTGTGSTDLAKSSEIALTNYDAIVADMQAMVQLAGALKGLMGEGGDVFLQKLAQALQLAIKIAQTMGKAGTEEGAGLSDILGLIGGFVPLLFLAGGGPASSGRPYVVGEKGPELFVPDRSGVVLPNYLLKYAELARMQTNWSSMARAAGGAVTAGGGGFYGTVIVTSEVEQAKSIKFFDKTLKPYNTRQGIK